MSWKEMLMDLVGSSVLTIFLLLFHLETPSMVNGNRWPAKGTESHARTYIQEVVTLHQSLPEFSKRVTTTAIISAAGIFFNDQRDAFVAVQFSLIFFVLLLLSMLGRELGLQRSERWVSLGLFVSSFSVLFSFFASNYTYDEPAQYLFVFLAILFGLREWLVGYSLAFFLALLTRETTLFLLPGLGLLLWMPKAVNKATSKKIFSIALPVGLYGFFLLCFGASESSQRFVHWRSTFRSFFSSTEAFINVFLALGVVGYLAVRCKNLPKHLNSFRLAALSVFIVNTPIVLLFTKPREFRLLALPLVFLWPIAGRLLKEYIAHLRLSPSLHWKGRSFLPPTLGLLMSVMVFILYRPTDAPFSIALRVYAMLLTLFLFFLLRIPKVIEGISYPFRRPS